LETGEQLGPGMAVVMGFPFDEYSSFMCGPALAPPRIREALNTGSINMCSENGNDMGVDPRFRDMGDLALAKGVLDMDVLDPAFAPGVSHQEPGGLSRRELIGLIQDFKGTLVGADIVELNPRRDPLGITAMAAGKCPKEISARMLNRDS